MSFHDSVATVLGYLTQTDKPGALRPPEPIGGTIPWLGLGPTLHHAQRMCVAARMAITLARRHVIGEKLSDVPIPDLSKGNAFGFEPVAEMENGCQVQRLHLGRILPVAQALPIGAEDRRKQIARVVLQHEFAFAWSHVRSPLLRRSK